MKHVTVLLNEAIAYLNIKKDGIYIDATLGGAGHSNLILKKLESGFLYAFDQDLAAIKIASEKLSKYQNKKIIHANFINITQELEKFNIKEVDGILLDLGMSSFQIDDKKRGFSYLVDTNLDMRMNQNNNLTASDIVNNYKLDDLTKIFYEYGEEKNSYKIAREIIKKRPILSTKMLVDICDKINYNRKGHSAKKIFQALRIEVNDEINVLKEALKKALDILKPGGRIVVITFHSLEDKIVKHFFKDNAIIKMPKNMPIIKNIIPKLKFITKKPIYPTEEEIINNSRSKSAKMRVAQKN